MSAYVTAVRRVFVLLLLTLWVPALLHCRIEAAGFAAEGCCAGEKQAPRDLSCDDDSCEIAEGAFTASQVVDAPAPCLFLPLESLLAPQAALVICVEPPALGVIESAAAPPEIAPTWAFRVRAALPARAPSLAS